MKTAGNLAIEIRGLTKIYSNSFGQEVLAVKNVNLRIFMGEIVLICGPNGSGKTTLLSLIGCLLRPTTGSIRLASQETTELAQKKLSRFRLLNIGFVFQHFRLLECLTALENVELPMNLAGWRRPESRCRALEALQRMGVEQRSDFLPATMSGGERQRVAIARAFIHTPPLILADEPTGNLDSKAGRNTVELLCAAAKEKNQTVVIVSHDERIRSVADRVISMEDGNLVEQV